MTILPEEKQTQAQQTAQSVGAAGRAARANASQQTAQRQPRRTAAQQTAQSAPTAPANFSSSSLDAAPNPTTPTQSTNPAMRWSNGEPVVRDSNGNPMLPTAGAAQQTARADGYTPYAFYEQLESSYKPGRYAEQYLAANKDPRLTPEQEAREKRRRKWSAISAAIGDGISALSNLYFTTQYAPARNLGETQSEANRRRWEEIDRDRQERWQQWQKGFMAAQQADDKAEQGYRAWMLAQAKDKREADREKEEAKDREDERRRRAADDEHKRNMQPYERRRAEAEAKEAEERARYAGQYQRSRINANNRSNRGGSGETYSLRIGRNGKVETYPNAKEYAAAVYEAAERLGIPTYEEVVTKPGYNGFGKETRRVNRSVDQLAGLIRNYESNGGGEGRVIEYGEEE